MRVRTGLNRVMVVMLLSWAGYAELNALPTALEVEEALRRANDYFIANHVVGVANWNRGAYQTGNHAVWTVLGERRYRERAEAWARANSWGLGRPFDGNRNHRLHADSQVAGQVYLDLYREVALPERRTAVATVMDELIANLAWNDGRADTIDDFSADDWWWVDAYYMAAPTLARMANLEDAEIYRTQLRAMYDWMKETRALFDADEGLWYRDAASMNEVSSSGKKVFWSRGNGWVMAGMVRVLDELPLGHPDRLEFTEMLQIMAAALLPLQGADGFWRSSLLDPGHYPNPETSGTAFFTAAMAWGIRHGVLDTATYGPVVAAAWQGMVEIALGGDGRLGYIQNVGRAPAPASPTELHDFGMGAFLLAGAELLKLLGAEVPVLAIAGADQFLPAAPGVYEVAVQLDGSASPVRRGELLSATWWIGEVFLASGLNADLRLPLGSHPLTLRIAHSEGATFEDSIVVNVGTGEAVPVQSVSASASQDPNLPGNTIDGDLTTRWSAEGPGQWIQFDLGAAFPIHVVELAFYQGDSRTATFDISFSGDGNSWRRVLDRAVSSGNSLALQPFATGGQLARFVRITGFGNSVNQWNSLTGVVIRRSAGAADDDDNGLPDAWEIVRLGSAGGHPDTDTDRDGFTDRQEFIAGTDPRDPGDFPRPDSIVHSGSNRITLIWDARAAFGPGYHGATRFYRIEYNTSLAPDAWAPVEGIDPIPGRNLPVHVDLPAGSAATFYRLRTQLEDTEQ